MHYRKKYTVILILTLLVIALIASYKGLVGNTISTSDAASMSPVSQDFIASIDTMKESRDTETRPLSGTDIAQDISLIASLNATHITVATNWDYTSYFRQWVTAVHAAGKHIWVRGHPNQWENDNGATGMMTPSMYLTYERNFILQNADLFKSGDILDTCSETEQGKYWKSKSSPWSSQTTAEYNQFIRDSITIADAAFAEKKITGVITTIHSVNAYIAKHRLEKDTIAKMGVVTIDSYPDQYDTNVSQAVSHRLSEISGVYNTVHVPLIIGEIGYSNKIQVSDQLQKDVLRAEFNAIQQLPYIVGLNYWVGPGGPGHGGYTNIFAGSFGRWTLRPAAYDLKSMFQFEETK